MAIDDDTMTGILIESDVANASTGVNLQSAAAALNIVTAAQLFVINQNWDGLETCLAEFLTKVQGEKFYPHPGLFCSLYQAHISYLIGNKQFGEARAVFDGKVKPLINQDNGHMYKPFDLEARVEMLYNCVNNCLPLPTDEVEDMNVVLSDYLMLYFPTSLQSKVNRTNSISDFLITFSDGKRKQHRCLACQWVMPASATSSSIVHHIKHSKQVNCCRRVTKWMLEYLTCVKGEKEIDIQDISAASAGAQSRKRKAPLNVSDHQQSVISEGHALKILSDLSGINLFAMRAVNTCKSQSATESKAREILFRQDELISELKNLFLTYVDEHVPLVGSPLAFIKIKALVNLSDEFLTLLKHLPSDVSELLLDQDKKITELRSCFMVAAAERLPPTSPNDVMPPSTNSSESISSNLCPL